MTSPPPPLPVPADDALDAAVSAVVDGVATPEERAAVAAAPDGAARLAAQRAVAEAVRSSVGAQSPAAAASALAAALAAFDEELQGQAEPGPATPPAAAGGPGAVVRPKGPARSGRALPRLGLLAAAVVLLVGVGALAVAVLGRSTDTPAFTTAARPSAKQANGSESLAASTTAGRVPSLAAPKSGGPGPGAGATPGPATPPAPAGAIDPATASGRAADANQPDVVDGGDIGRQSKVADLTQRVAAALSGPPDTTMPQSTAALPTDVEACVRAAPSAVQERLGALRYRAVGTWFGTDALFLAYDRPAEPPHLLLVLTRNGCTLLTSTPF